eukprot:2719416-Rhodomonas_salina.14
MRIEVKTCEHRRCEHKTLPSKRAVRSRTSQTARFLPHSPPDIAHLFPQSAILVHAVGTGAFAREHLVPRKIILGISVLAHQRFHN